MLPILMQTRNQVSPLQGSSINSISESPEVQSTRTDLIKKAIQESHTVINNHMDISVLKLNN